MERTTSSSIWTFVADYISYDSNLNDKHTSNTVEFDKKN